MDNNQICNIRGAPFNHLSRLRVLSLRNNRMTTVTEYAFQKLRSNVVNLDVDGNPLSCSCKMLWLLGWLEDTHSEGPRCGDGTLFREARISYSDCRNSRIVEPVIPGCEGDTVQSSVVESSQLSALTANLKNSSNGVQKPEADYFYDEYIEYQYEEINSTESQDVTSTTAAPVTQKSYHFTTGDTPTLYARPNGPKINTTNLGLGLDDLKKAQQQQQQYNGLTFFGIPLPSLSFGNLWKGNSGRSVDQPQNRPQFPVGKVQPVSKKFDGKNTAFKTFVTPQTETGFVPVVPTKNGFTPVIETVTAAQNPSSVRPNQGIVTPVERQNILKDFGPDDFQTKETISKPVETSSESPSVSDLAISFKSPSNFETATVATWPVQTIEKAKLAGAGYDYPVWSQPTILTTETTAFFQATDDFFKMESTKTDTHVFKNNWYFENYNKTNLKPYIGVNESSTIKKPLLILSLIPVTIEWLRWL